MSAGSSLCLSLCTIHQGFLVDILSLHPKPHLPLNSPSRQLLPQTFKTFRLKIWVISATKNYLLQLVQSTYYNIYITSFIFQVEPEPPLDREECPLSYERYHFSHLNSVPYKEKYVYWPMKGTTFSLLDPVQGTEKKDFCPMEVPPSHTWTLWSLSFLFFYFS